MILKKEFRESRWRLIIGLIIFTAIAISIPFTYEMVKEMIKTIPLPQSFSEQLKAESEKLFELGFEYYLWSQWFPKNLLQMGTILAIIMGMGLIASEASKGTIEFLLSKPITRERALFEKFLVGAIELIFVALFSTLILYPASNFAGYKIAVSSILLALIPTIIGVIFIFVLTLLYSILLDDPVKVFAASIVSVLVLAIPGWFEKTQKYSLFRVMGAKEAFFDGKLILSELGIVLTATILLYLLSLYIFKKKDF